MVNTESHTQSLIKGVKGGQKPELEVSTETYKRSLKPGKSVFPPVSTTLFHGHNHQQLATPKNHYVNLHRSDLQIHTIVYTGSLQWETNLLDFFAVWSMLTEGQMKISDSAAKERGLSVPAVEESVEIRFASINCSNNALS